MKTKQVRRWVALLLAAAMVAVMPAGAVNGADTEARVFVDSAEAFVAYCEDSSFNGIVLLDADIEVHIENDLDIKQKYGDTRHVTIDLNGHNIVCKVESYGRIDVDAANTIIKDSVGTGAILFQVAEGSGSKDRERSIEIFPYGVWSADDTVNLRLENLSIISMDKSIEAEVYVS